MAQFLSDSYLGTEAELLQLDKDKNFDDKKAVALLSQLSVLGILNQLPLILKTLKEQMSQQDKRVQQIRSNAKDPLAEETEDGL